MAPRAAARNDWALTDRRQGMGEAEVFNTKDTKSTKDMKLEDGASREAQFRHSRPP